ncbi:MAG TPA: GNAT family N-acetyltransferase [Bryobacteraceae bacterium]|nr:GNAT family N-acetyltransferase [Bryobacteraceae bacterium]
MQPSAVNQEAEALLHWKLAVRAMASGAAEWSEPSLGGMTAIWAGSMFPLTNQFFVEDRENIAEMVPRAVDFAASRQVPWMLSCCRDWLTDEALAAMRKHGMAPAMQLTYMTAGRLRAPVHPEPHADYRLVNSLELAGVACDLNCAAYGMPVEWGRSGLASPRMWTEEGVGIIAYVDNVPVSTASVVPTNGCLNVVCVATAQEYRGRGHAEATMRRALDLAARELRLPKTVLHASDMGLPIYERMGYQPATALTVFAPEHG